MFWLLVKIRLVGLWNVARHTFERHSLLTSLLTLTGAFIFLLLFGGFRFFLSLAFSRTGLEDLVYQLFYFLFLFLLAGAVPFVASTLLHANDYGLLSAAPIRPRDIVAAKLLDATVTNSLQFALIGLPAIAACGSVLGLTPAGWALLPLLVALFVLLPALATALALLVALAFLGMRRIRGAVTLVNAAMASVVCLTIVSQTGQIQFHHSFSHGGLMVAGTSPAARLGPSAPFAWSLIRLADGDTLTAMRELGLMMALIGLLFGACVLWGGHLLSAAALAEEGEGERVRAVDSDPLRTNRRGLLAPFSAPVAALIAKDLRYVLRDSVLLSQLGMPVILFFVPFVLAIQQDTVRPVSATTEIYPFAVAMTAVILFMQTSILSLSSIGLESRSFWIVRSSPNGAQVLLWAKFLMSTMVSGAVGIALTWLGAFVFHAPLWAALVQCVYVVLLAAGLCGLGVGISAALPRFVYDNPAHRVSVWALILGFLTTVAYLTLTGLLSFFTWHLSLVGDAPAPLVYAAGASVLLLLTLLVIVAPMAVGARRIEVYQWEH